MTLIVIASVFVLGEGAVVLKTCGVEAVSCWGVCIGCVRAVDLIVTYNCTGIEKLILDSVQEIHSGAKCVPGCTIWAS